MSVLMMMLIVSLSLGLAGLIFFLWGLKHGQFDDGERMMNNALFDDENDLNEAFKREEKLKKVLKEKSAKKADL